MHNSQIGGFVTNVGFFFSMAFLAIRAIARLAGGHEEAGFNFDLPHDLVETPTAQAAWRFCQKCNTMFFNGFPGNKGRCPTGGGHEEAGFEFDLPHDVAPTPTAQDAWRFCQKCNAMFFNGPDKGHCPTGDAHDAAGFNFVLPHDLPSILSFDFSPIVFKSGVPVGGFSHVTIRQDGSFTFSGHFHDSGEWDSM